MFQNFRRHFSKTMILAGKKAKPICGPKEPAKPPCDKPKPPTCNISAAVCKKVPTSPNICKVDSKPGGGDSGHGGALWKIISCGVCIPIVIIFTILRHIKEEDPISRPPFKKYEYMRIRTSKFPWGDGNHSLFHNPCYNALPEGYEDEKCDDELLSIILKKGEEEEAVRIE